MLSWFCLYDFSLYRFVNYFPSVPALRCKTNDTIKTADDDEDPAADLLIDLRLLADCNF